MLIATVVGNRPQFIKSGPVSVALAAVAAAGALAGIGFRVSLLLANLAFAGDAALRADAVLGVLCGSVASLVLAAIVVSWRARHHGKRAA